MSDPSLRFHRLRLRTNPFDVLEPEHFLDVVPEPPGLRQLLSGDWRALEFAGPIGSGKTTRILFSLRILREKGASCAYLRLASDGRWLAAGSPVATPDVLALDEADRRIGWFGSPPPPPEAATAGRIVTAVQSAGARPLGVTPARTVTLDELGTDEILAYHRARVDAVSTGPPGRFALTPDALHRLHNLSEANYYRMNRILYQAFEGLVRDEPLEEKAIERGYGGFLLEEQESAAERGRDPAVR